MMDLSRLANAMAKHFPGLQATIEPDNSKVLFKVSYPAAENRCVVSQDEEWVYFDSKPMYRFDDTDQRMITIQAVFYLKTVLGDPDDRISVVYLGGPRDGIEEMARRYELGAKIAFLAHDGEKKPIYEWRQELGEDGRFVLVHWRSLAGQELDQFKDEGILRYGQVCFRTM